MRALLIGAGLAMTAGLSMGSAMRPDLLTDHRPEGPQVFGSWTGESTGPFDPGVSLTAYSGKVPDYVIGTDTLHYTQPQTPDVVEPEPTELAVADPIPQADDYMPVAFHETPPEPVIYPSLDGNVSYASDASAG